MGYINHISRFHLLPRVAEAIRLLNENSIPAIIVTNQSGLARGYFPEQLLTDVHNAMNEELAENGAHIDGIYICPHHPEAREKQFRIACECRKPNPGLLLKAAEELQLDLSRSYVVGDRWSDIKTAVRCNAKSILVLTGYGRGELEYIGPQQQIKPDHVTEDLFEAVQWILEDIA
jgi:D-glycero-D-manno-heptose 1,7-bisphosphate phosphatase